MCNPSVRAFTSAGYRNSLIFSRIRSRGIAQQPRGTGANRFRFCAASLAASLAAASGLALTASRTIQAVERPITRLLSRGPGPAHRPGPAGHGPFECEHKRGVWFRGQRVRPAFARRPIRRRHRRRSGRIGAGYGQKRHGDGQYGPLHPGGRQGPQRNRAWPFPPPHGASWLHPLSP